MSGFVAIIVNQPLAEVLEQDVAGLADAYGAVRGIWPSTSIVGGSRVRGRVFNGPGDQQALIESQDGSWAAVSGVAYFRGALLERPLSDLEGQFALLRYNAETDTVLLASDPFGMYGLFIAETESHTYVSTSALALARCLRAPSSRLGVETFLLAGYHCGSRTNWEGIRRVGGGEAMTFGPDGTHKSTYWRPEVDRSVRSLSLEASVDRCLAPAIEAVRVAGDGPQPIWCDLTGGYDSRLLCLLARSAGLRFMTNTSGGPAQEDVILARRIATEMELDWSLYSLPDSWPRQIQEVLPDALGWGDSNLDALQLSTVLWTHGQKARRSRRLLNGGGGEHYWSYAWQHEYGRAGRSGRTSLDNWVRVRMLRSVDTDVFARNPMTEVTSDLRARMEPVIEPYLDEPRFTQADVLYAHKSTGHFGAYAAAAGASLDMALPFYTRASFTAAFSVSHRHRFGHRFYRHLIERMDPRVAAIPTAKGGPAQPRRIGNLRSFSPYYARLGVKGFNKATQRSLGRTFTHAASMEHGPAAAARAAAIMHVGERVDDWRSRALYDRASLLRLLEDAPRADFRRSALLGRILTVELAHRATDASI